VIQSLLALFNKVPSAPVEEVSFKFNPLNAELKPICHLTALLRAHLIFHVSRIRIKLAPTHLLTYYSLELPAIHYQEFFLEALVNVSS